MPNKRLGTEYPKRSGIIVTPKVNPKGSQAYRVDIAATITGTTREQRQFPTKAKAEEYATKRHLEITRFGHAAFDLNAWQRQDAARAIQILSRFNLTLEDAAKLAATHSKAARDPITVTELRNQFLAAPGRRKSKLIQRRSLTVHNLTWRTARFEKQHGKLSATEIQTEHVRAWLHSLGKLSPVSLNNYRRTLHAMFAYGVNEGFCVANPVAKVPLYDSPQKTPSILSVEECERLLARAEQTESTVGLLPYVTLGLFAGLRRSELQQLDWSAIKFPRKMVTVDGGIAKTGSIRNVSLSENALAWLSRCTQREGKIAPLNLNFRLRRLKAAANLTNWNRNELRHSFASYHYDLHQNAPLTSAQLGHTSGSHLLFVHYRSLVPLGDGERFFRIFPPQKIVDASQVSHKQAS